jgi:hypothetical protein
MHLVRDLFDHITPLPVFRHRQQKQTMPPPDEGIIGPENSGLSGLIIS